VKRPGWLHWPRRGRDVAGRAPLRWNRDAIVAAVPVAAVAGVAGWVSYSHIVALGMRTHQGPADSHLLPIPIDGLIVAGSWLIVAGSPLGWAGVALGVAGTLFANLEFGLPYGALPAIVSTWPAVAFTVATWMLERWLKRQAGRGGRAGRDGDGTGSASADDTTEDGRCPHGVAGTVDEAIVTAWLHTRDCLEEKPVQRQLAAAFGVHRTKVAALVGSLNGQHPQNPESGTEGPK
jgi:hypothetical protein